MADADLLPAGIVQVGRRAAFDCGLTEPERGEGYPFPVDRGPDVPQAVVYAIAFAVIFVLLTLFALVLRRLTGGRLAVSKQDRGRTRQPRLGIVDVYELDRQRQLVLLRRDNVEHLLLIGGLNDVVVETNTVRVTGARIPAAPTGM